jgi:hypothetical protein
MQHVNKSDLIQDKASNFLDLFILKLLLLNGRKEHPLMTSSSTSSSLSSFEANSSGVSINQSLNNSTMSNYVNRGKSLKDDCIRLMRQSLKCLLLNLQVEKPKSDEKTSSVNAATKSVDSRLLLDFTLNNSISNDSIVSAASNFDSKQQQQPQAETWTVSQDELIVQDIAPNDENLN